MRRVEQGPIDRAGTDEDALFLRIAVRAGALPAARAEEALALLRADAALRAGALCLERGWLTPAQARAVEAAAGQAEEPAPASDPAFDDLVSLKRLSDEGEVAACEELLRALAGGPYERLGDLLLKKAQQRAKGAASPAAPPGEDPVAARARAFDRYVRLKQAAQQGDGEEASRLAELLQDDPEFGRLAVAQRTKAYARRALAAARAEGGQVVRCGACGTPTAAGGPCPRCGAMTPDAARPPTSG